MCCLTTKIGCIKDPDETDVILNMTDYESNLKTRFLKGLYRKCL